MMNHGARSVLAAASLTIGAVIVPAAAAPDSSASRLLTAAQYNPAQFLPPPPVDGSPAAQAELAEVQRIVKERTAERLVQAQADDANEDVTAFAAVMGANFDLKTLPKTAKLFADLLAEEKPAAKAAKNFFLRNRPWVLDAALLSCGKPDAPKSSYPSGHATMGYSAAVVLAALAPEKAQAIMVRAADYAESRLVCGAHYRRDIVAGEVLGTTVAVELLATPGFEAEFDAARDELRAAHIVAN